MSASIPSSPGPLSLSIHIDFGRTSDFDIALLDPRAFPSIGACWRGDTQKGIRTGPLEEPHFKMLKLLALSEKPSTDYGRPVHFMVYAYPSIVDKLSETGMKIGVRVPGRALSWTLH